MNYTKVESSRETYRSMRLLLQAATRSLGQTHRFLDLRLQVIRMASKNNFKFVDIGANLSDHVYQGSYHGKQVHEDDLIQVLSRAKENGIKKIMITGGSLEDSRAALEKARLDECLYSTVGCHPTRSSQFESEGDPETYLQALIALASENKGKVVAVGEMGLDYDRLHFSSKETQLKLDLRPVGMRFQRYQLLTKLNNYVQKKERRFCNNWYFEKQMALVSATRLPVFLHCRAAHEDFRAILSRHRDSIPGGVVHSFTGTKEEALSALDLGFYIGINGCSLKTQENLDVMCSIPTDRLMIETDCPYCEVRPTHAGYKWIKTQFPTKKKEKYDRMFCVKSRNEPCTIVQVLEVMSGARGEDPHQLADAMFNNTIKLFFNGCDKSVS